MKGDRFSLLGKIFSLFFLIVTLRLFQIQIIMADEFKAQAQIQYQSFDQITPRRGNILTSDGYSVASSLPNYLLFADPQILNNDPLLVGKKLVDSLFENASPSAKAVEMEKLVSLLGQKKLRWVPLENKLEETDKHKIEALGIKGLGFEEQSMRFYPESSLAAQILGFTGKDETGEEKGYFGLEGYYNLDLTSSPGSLSQEKDPLGRPIAIGYQKLEKARGGRTLVTSIDRTAQYLIEKRLAQGLEKYGAKAGTVSVMEPQTGRILAMASLPSYSPADYFKTDPSLFKNPIVSETYEPGSTFKVLVMAAAFNENIVTPDSRCDKCSGPRAIDKYLIRTWDNKYRPNATMSEIIEHSDNVGMVYVAEKMGTEKFLKYYKLFGLNELTGVDLEEEANPPYKPDDKWTYIDRATASFGQGIVVTPIQMLRAVGALANNGRLMTPRVVDKIQDGNKFLDIPFAPGRQVIETKSIEQIKEIMVRAVDNGEAKWAKPKDFKIAGKTGTAQIAVSGHYDETKTIASFVGFAPADHPRFVMLVTLREPQSSQWGSETAAPLWFGIAKDLFRLWNITP